MVHSKLHKRIVHNDDNDDETLDTEKNEKMIVAKEQPKDIPLQKALEKHAPPQIILSLLNGNPGAASIKSENGSYPLHQATQNNFPTSVIRALIKAYPEALDIVNDAQCTPRDYHIRSETSKQILQRPTSCWIEDIEKEEYRDENQEKKTQLEEKIKNLKEALSAAKQRRDVASKMIVTVEPQLSEREQHAIQIDRLSEEKVQEMTNNMKKHIQYVKDRIEILEKNINEPTKEKSAEGVMMANLLKRSYMEETQKRYENVLKAHDVIRRDLRNLKELAGEESKKKML